MPADVTIKLRLNNWTDAQQMVSVLDYYSHILAELNESVRHHQITELEALEQLDVAVLAINRGVGESRYDSEHPRLTITIDARK